MGIKRIAMLHNFESNCEDAGEDEGRSFMEWLQRLSPNGETVTIEHEGKEVARYEGGKIITHEEFLKRGGTTGYDLLS